MIVVDTKMPVNCNTCYLTYEGRDDLTYYCCLTYREVGHNVPNGERHEKCPIRLEIPDNAIGIVGIQKGDYIYEL